MTEHVNDAQDPTGGGSPDDASKQLAALQKQVEEMQAAIVKRDDSLAKMQSDRDKVTAALEREQKRRERLEASRLKDVSKLPSSEQTTYLKQVAAEEHQKATRFELAHKYGLDPSALEGEFPSKEAMQLHAVELAQAQGARDMDAKLTQLTDAVQALADMQQKAQENPTVTPDAGGRHASQGLPEDALKEFDDLAEHYRNIRRHDLATQAVLARIHRDPSKVMEPATPSADLPPELQAKLRRR